MSLLPVIPRLILGRPTIVARRRALLPVAARGADRDRAVLAHLQVEAHPFDLAAQGQHRIVLLVRGQPKEVALARLWLFVGARDVLASAMKILSLTPLERM